MTCPLHFTGITLFQRYYGAVRPWAGASVISASRGFRLCLFPYHRQPGSQVPYKSQDWVHATSTPDTAWSVSRLLPCCSQISRTLRFRCRPCIFDESPVVHLRSSPQPPHDVILMSRLLTMTFTTTAFDCSSSWLFGAFSCKTTPKDLPSSSAQHALFRAS